MRTGRDACVTNHVYDTGKAGFVTHPHMGLNVEGYKLRSLAPEEPGSWLGHYVILELYTILQVSGNWKW